eukprot:SAG22_NODE_11223_length_495_cov_0.502525_1_plen_44_part_10
MVDDEDEQDDLETVYTMKTNTTDVDEESSSTLPTADKSLDPSPA